MKINAVLLAILLGVGGVAYYTQEHLPEQKRKNMMMPYEALGDLKGIRIKSVKLEKKGQGFAIAGRPFMADASRARALAQALESLEVKQVLDPKDVYALGEEHFLPREAFFDLLFEQGEVRVWIGEKLPFNGQFYGKVQTPQDRRFCVLAGLGHGALLNWINKEESFFYPQGLSSFLKGARKIEYETKMGRPYTLDLEKREVSLRPFEGAQVDGPQILSFFERLQALQAQQVRMSQGAKREKKFGQMIIDSPEGPIKLLVYGEYGHQWDGLFVFFDPYGLVWKFSFQDKKLLLPHYQQFIQKSPFPISSVDDIKISSQDLGPQKRKSLLTFLSEKSRWVAPVTDGHRKLFQRKIFDLKGPQKSFSLYLFGRELVLLDLGRRIGHYYSLKGSGLQGL